MWRTSQGRRSMADTGHSTLKIVSSVQVALGRDKNKAIESYCLERRRWRRLVGAVGPAPLQVLFPRVHLRPFDVDGMRCTVRPARWESEPDPEVSGAW